MKKKIAFLLLFFWVILLFPASVRADFPTTVHLFYGEGCPHCQKERQFLSQLKQTYPQLTVQEHEVYYSQENSTLLTEVARQLNTPVGGVPFLVIGTQPTIGFSEGTTTREIESQIQACIAQGCEDFVTGLNTTDDSKQETPPDGGTTLISVPFLGQINPRDVSLPVVTITLAFLDGFNPCAMWALLFLISLLLGLHDRKRMWILGAAFIITSALVYYLFLASWLNLFLIFGVAMWMRTIIGLVALVVGYVYLRDFWVNRHGGCSVTGGEKRQALFAKLRQIVVQQQLLIALGGIVLLAIAVNMVELICSAGLPVIYTQILTMSDLPAWQYQLYLWLYIFIFMLDDLFVFFTAMITLQMVGVQSKYARYSHFIGGILMIVIGLLLVLKPEWLMFG